MSATEIAALIAAGAFVLLVLLLAIPLFKLGRTTEAVTYWQKAKATGDYSELLEKKLNEKKLYE